MRPFRFAVDMYWAAERDSWRRKCRLAERLGFDVIMLPDHLNAPAPFPALVSAAEATERVRVGTSVLNAGFWNPALLAREIATTDRLTGGRLEVGLGAGYMRREYEDAGIPWRPAADRIAHLEHTVAVLDDLLCGGGTGPGPAQLPRPPLMIAGNSDRVLDLAARRADIVGFSALAHIPGRPSGALRVVDAAGLDERVAYARRQAGPRWPSLELNLLVQEVVPGADRGAAAARWNTETHYRHLSVEQLLAAPPFLTGTPAQMADQVRGWRERFGFSYITVHEESMEAFAPVIELLADDRAPRPGTPPT